MTGPGNYSIDPNFQFAPAPYGGTPEEWVSWANELPVSVALGLRAEQLHDGSGVFRLDTPPLEIYNPNGAIPGSFLIAAADQAMGCVAMTVLAPGHLPVTASIHSQYKRPAMPPARLEGEVTKRGRALVFVDIQTIDADERLCNSAHGTMMTVAPPENPDS